MVNAKDMALFLFGFNVNFTNQFLDFKKTSLGPTLTATLNFGNYTATEFAAEIKRAMEFVDGTNIYTVTIDRSINAGHSNLMHVSTSGSFLSILFGTGIHALASPASLMGFNNADYTGQTSYAGFTNCGTILIPDLPTWNYQGPDEKIMADGTKNVSANGIKETLVFAQVQFFAGEWRYITNFEGNTQKDQWIVFLKYATRQQKFEFSPSINEDVNLFYACTLESTTADGNGMAYDLQLMVDTGLYRFYKTGLMKFRLNTVIF